MKNSTLLILGLCAGSMVTPRHTFAQKTVVWTGAESKTWNKTAPNWVDINNPFFPTIQLAASFADGDYVSFVDVAKNATINIVNDTVGVAASVRTGSLIFETSRNIVLQKDTDGAISVDGVFEKKGSGKLTSSIEIEADELKMQEGVFARANVADPQVWGKKIVFDAGAIDLGYLNSSSAYGEFRTPLHVNEGKSATIYTSRYSRLFGSYTGSGDLNIYSRGERVFVGSSTESYDFSAFTGTLNIYKEVVAGAGPGYYGLILFGKGTYDVETGDGVNEDFAGKIINLKSGASLTSHSGVRAYRIGELNAEDETCNLFGYYTSSTTPVIYWLVGGLNTDVEFPARIVSQPLRRDNKVVFVKEGTGTYRFTNNNNFFTGGLIVNEGKAFISNSMVSNEYTGTNYSGGVTVTVNANGELGGTGRISGNTDVFGKIAPGENNIGTLSFEGFWLPAPTEEDPMAGSWQGASVNLNMRPGSVMELEFNSPTEHDLLSVSRKITYFVDEETGDKPTVRIIARSGSQINNGDRYVLVQSQTASGEFNVELPQVDGVEWELIEEIVEANPEEGIVASYQLVLVAKGTGTGIVNTETISSKVKIYPVPVVDNFTIEVDGFDVQKVELIDTAGRLINVWTLSGRTNTISLSDVRTGIYFVKAYTENGVVVKRIVKK